MIDHATKQRQLFIAKQSGLLTENQVMYANLMESLTMEVRRFRAVMYLRQQGKYILDQGSHKPAWGLGEAA